MKAQLKYQKIFKVNSLYKQSVFKDAAKVAHLTYQIGETDLLRKKSLLVDKNQIKSSKIQSVISKLTSTLKEFKKLTGKGRGIAAIQVGIPLQIVVIFINNLPVTIINPKIIRSSKTYYLYPEICMSANPIIAKVARPSWVTVQYLNELGEKKLWDDKKDRIVNRVIQHEIDHLNGVVNIDLVRSRDLILDSDPHFFENAKFKKIL